MPQSPRRRYASRRTSSYLHSEATWSQCRHLAARNYPERDCFRTERLMTGTKLYWIDGPWPGQLAIASRPRGGEWLADEMSAWRRAGISHIVSLLTSEEERDLNLKNEVREAESQGMTFTSFPIADRRIPTSEASVRSLVERLTSELLSGEKIVIHCRQGVGRSGLLGCVDPYRKRL